MGFSIKQVLVATTVGVLSLSSYAQPGESFQTVCINSWMKKIGDSTDKVDFKNFGEKYCTCAAAQPLDSDAAIQKAIQRNHSQDHLLEMTIPEHAILQSMTLPKWKGVHHPITTMTTFMLQTPVGC